jgi:uncharacterized protein YaiL (DUF2058 family)
MSTSLRDQLLKAGLIDKKQVNEAERQLQRKERLAAHNRPQSGSVEKRPALPAAKVARDQALNRKQQEKAERKARLAQVKQLVEQNRLPPAEGEPPFNFVDGSRIRHIPITAANRERLTRGEIVIVRHEGRYDLVPASIASRVGERDPSAVIPPVTANESAPLDAAYAQFAVPDDLIW